MRIRWAASVVAAAVVLVPACSSSDTPAAVPPSSNSTSTTDATPTTVREAETLRVLVSNDDGVGAPGIDALVEALRILPDTEVIVVAPQTNQSGAGGKVTAGATLAVADAATKSGFAAKAVAGYPADTIVWALDRGGIATRPHLVIAGINEGQNLGTYIDISGTVGAARAAAQRGIPALSVSQGFGEPPDYPSGVTAALAWLAAHRAALVARDVASTAPSTVTNLNIPTCPAGKPRATPAVTPLAGAAAKPFDPVDCTTAYGAPTSDVDAFLHGYVAQTDNLPIR